MSSFQIVLNQIFLFVTYGIIGIIAVKIRLFKEEDLSVLSRLVLRITIPLMLFTNTINGATRDEFLHDLPVMAVTVLMYLLLYLVSEILVRLFHMTGDEGRVYRACTIFGNIGFIGIPIIAALFPERGMLYVALFTVVDQWIVWTLGWGLCGPAEGGSGLRLTELLKKMVNPSLCAIVLSLIFVFTGWKLPGFLNKGLTNIGSMTTPISMIFLGGTLCFTDMKKYLKKVDIYGAIVVKMLIFPVIFLNLLRFFPGINDEIRVTMTVLTTLPVMNVIPIFARTRGTQGEYAIAMLFMTSIASLVTIPIISLLF